MAKALDKGGALNVRPFPKDDLHWRCIQTAPKIRKDLKGFVIEALEEKIERVEEDERKKKKPRPSR